MGRAAALALTRDNYRWYPRLLFCCWHLSHQNTQCRNKKQNKAKIHRLPACDERINDVPKRINAKLAKDSNKQYTKRLKEFDVGREGTRVSVSMADVLGCSQLFVDFLNVVVDFVVQCSCYGSLYCWRYLLYFVP